MKVKLLSHTDHPEKLIACAAKLCYSSSDIENLYEQLKTEQVEHFVEMLASVGHESPLEHVTFTFAIEGVSRALLAQITRHRIASFSVQSQRYVKANSFSYILPPEIDGQEEVREIYERQLEQALESYHTIAKLLQKKHSDRWIADGMDPQKAQLKAEKKAIEDARFVLPNAAATKMIMTMNARSLLHFFELRCCRRAQWEIRELANQMLQLVYPTAPSLFAKAGPPCVRRGCGEGSHSCGEMDAVKKFYSNLKKNLENTGCKEN